AMRAAIAVGPNIDNEGAGLDVDFISAEIEDEIERAGLRHGQSVEPALARHEADIEPADARSRAVQYVEAVPTVLDDAERLRRLRGKRQDRGAVRPRKSARA